MVYRKGELTPAAIDRGWPHQVALREAACTGANHKIHLDFCKDLSLCPRGHSVYHDDTTWRVFCFADPAHAALFRERFGGEPFDPKDRGRGAAWARWHTPASRPAAKAPTRPE
jgi:hypothetical protein